MTPKIWNKVSVLVEEHENTLSRFGLVFLAIGLVFGVFCFGLTEVGGDLHNSFFGVFLSFGFVLLLAGLGIAKSSFRTEDEFDCFDQYWSSISLGKKIFLWYVSLFLTFYFLIALLFILVGIGLSSYSLYSWASGGLS